MGIAVLIKRIQSEAFAEKRTLRADLPWWTWVLPVIILQLGTQLSLHAEFLPGMSVWYLPIPLGLVMSIWWGPRVLIGIYLNALFSNRLWGLDQWQYWPIYAIPETLAVFAGWFAYTRIFKGKAWLPDLRQTTLFLATAVFPSALINDFLLSGVMVLLGKITPHLMSDIGISGFMSTLLDGLTIAVPLAMFLTAPLERRGLSLTHGAQPTRLVPLGRSRRMLAIESLFPLLGFVLAGLWLPFHEYWFIYGFFALWVALRYGVGAAAATNVWIDLVILLAPVLLPGIFQTGWEMVEFPFEAYVELIFVCTAVLMTGRAISDMKAEVEQRRVAEEAQRQSEAKLTAMLNHTQDILSIIDANGKMIYASPAGTRILGYERQDLEGKNIFDLLHPEDAPLIYQAFNRLLAQPGEVQRVELRMRKKDWSYVWFEMIASNHLDNPNIRGVVSNSRDISERKQAQKALEQRAHELGALYETSLEVTGQLDVDVLLRTIVERAVHLLDAPMGGIDLVTPDGKHIMLVVNYRMPVNPDAVTLSMGEGLAGRVALTGKPLMVPDYQSWEGRADAYRNNSFRRMLGVPLKAGEETIGVIRVADDRNTGLFDEDQVHLLSLFANQAALAIETARLYEEVQRELEERRRAEEEVVNLNTGLEQRVALRTSELETARDELEAFAYSVSHDLRAPLRSIDGFSRILSEDYQGRLDADGLYYLERIRSATSWMAEMVDSLLQLSRLNRAELIINTVDLSQIAQAISTQLQETQPERKVDWAIHKDLSAQGDHRLLDVVLHNLLENAWKFTSKRPDAQIEFGKTQDGTPEAFFVRDNGVGFDMTYAGKLFLPFQRLHAREEFDGNGIGLATVKRIITRHGGKIWAESQPGQGTTFFFTL